MVSADLVKVRRQVMQDDDSGRWFYAGGISDQQVSMRGSTTVQDSPSLPVSTPVAASASASALGMYCCCAISRLTY